VVCHLASVCHVSALGIFFRMHYRNLNFTCYSRILLKPVGADLDARVQSETETHYGEFLWNQNNTETVFSVGYQYWNRIQISLISFCCSNTVADVIVASRPHHGSCSSVCLSVCLSCCCCCLLIGEAYMKLSDWRSAEFWYREALRVKPDHIPAHLTLAKLLQRHVSKSSGIMG